MNSEQFDVIIVGGGPTGVALGIELGLNNIKALILEKHKEPLLSPRAQSLNARSMEFFMRWGLDKELKKAILLPGDYPIQGVWCQNLNGKTYAVSSSNDWLNDDISPQRGVRIPLYLTEEVLRNKLNDLPSVLFLKQHNVIDLNFTENHVNVIAKNIRNKTITFNAPIVVGCDGANSIVRMKANIEFEQLSPPNRVINVLFKSKSLAKKITVEKGFLYYLLESVRPGAIGPIDLNQGLWYAQVKDVSQVEKIDFLNVSQILEDMVGFRFQKKIIQAHFWQMQIQIANTFVRNNRIFLVGDSAHAFVPTGGFGLNTGLGDVVNLGWKLAAFLKHDASVKLLATYEQERRPVCLSNLKLAEKNANDLLTLRNKYNPQQNPEEFAKANASLANQYTNCLSATMGYKYCTESYEQKNKEIDENYVPLVEEGYFLPHRWIENDQSIYDKLSATYWTLIISGENNDILDKQNVTFKILKLPKDIYPVNYILIRPDWHIAYAGNEFLKSHFLACMKKYL